MVRSRLIAFRRRRLLLPSCKVVCARFISRRILKPAHYSIRIKLPAISSFEVTAIRVLRHTLTITEDRLRGIQYLVFLAPSGTAVCHVA